MFNETFRSVGETKINFVFDVNHHTRHAQRIEDFLTGAGAEVTGHPLCGWYIISIPKLAKARWDKWLSQLI